MAVLLLALALIGYCGLPSNSPTAMSQTHWQFQAFAIDTQSRGFVTPTQAKEYRARDDALGGDTPDYDGDAALVPADPVAVEIMCGTPGPASGQPSCVSAAVRTGNHSRAPPVA